MIGALLAALVFSGTAVRADVNTADSGIDLLRECANTLVTANVDCAIGESVALSERPQADVDELDDQLLVEFAPWCDGLTDTTRYGCPVISGPSPVSAQANRLGLLVARLAPKRFMSAG